MKVTIIEGTPEEIALALPQLRNSPLAAAVASPPVADSDQVSAEDDEVTYVGTDVARSVLTRISLSKEQRIILQTLYKAGPKTVLATELMKATGYTRPQFSGLMGAFGRRVSHTEGYESDSWFFDQDWNDEAKCYEYSLPETVREAMRLEKLV